MNFIKKINTYLLEQYPLIWNTRLVWMLGVALVSHLLFFFIGYFSVSNQLDIQSEYRLSEFYFGTSVVFFNVLFSIILLLIWIIYYLQNNAFKNLYRIKKGTLFAQFCIIIFIFFININQYYSFNQGLKLKIRNLYSWEEVDADIKEFNKTAIFLINERNNYSIDDKKYPAPFPLKYEETDYKTLIKRIDTSKAYFKYGAAYYQFYKIDTALLNKDSRNGNIVVYNDYSDEYIANKQDFKYRIVKDVLAYKEDVAPCLLNYSSTLYSYGQSTVTYNARIKYYEELFKRGNESEIKENLQSFLNLSKKYQIDHNLNIPEWYDLLVENNYVYDKTLREKRGNTNVYEIIKKEKARKNYKITQFILKDKVQEWNEKKYNYTKKVEVEERLISRKDHNYYDKNSNQFSEVVSTETYSKFSEESLSNIPYCDFGSLDNFFKNTYGAYQSSEIKESLYFYIILSLIFGLLLFLFKITNIKTLLLSFVAAAIILIITGLLIAYIPYSIRSMIGTNMMEYLIAIMTGLSVITASILAFKLKWKKLITAILFSLSIFAIPLTLLFLIFMYERYLGYEYRSKDPLLQWINKYAFWIVLFIWMLSIGLYTKAIRKWKGLPE